MKMQFSQIESAEKEAMQWLLNAYTHGNGGFPHSRWMFLPTGLAWNRDYAETTGYLIENLLNLNAGSILGLSKIALTAGNWLLSVQSKDGHFHSGTQFIKPSAFNTAQILFGLDELYSYNREEKYFLGLSKAYQWLIDAINQDGIFTKGLYVEHYYATYYTRALWPLILIDQKYFNSKHQEKLLKSLMHLFSYKNQYGFFNDSGFYPRKPSSLHTVAYALEGFYECSKLTGQDQIHAYIQQALNRICELIQEYQKTPAFIYPDLKTDFSFVCVSGQAQICALLLKMYVDNGNEEYKKTATSLFKQLLSWQIKSNSVEHNGAFPSCIPVWKNYFSFRYTNWTMKFFLDSCYLMKKVLIEN